MGTDKLWLPSAHSFLRLLMGHVNGVLTEVFAPADGIQTALSPPVLAMR